MPLRLLDSDTPVPDIDRAALARTGVPDRLAELAALRLGCRAAMISLPTADELVPAGRYRLPAALEALVRGPLDERLPCVRIVRHGLPVRSASPSTDFAEAGRTLEAAGIRGLLGVPIRGSDGGAVGALTVLDARPRAWTDAEVAELEELAGTVAHAVEQVRVARRGQRAAEQYRHVFHTSPHASYVLDQEGRLSEVNHATSRLLQHPPSELVGRHFGALVAREARDEATAAFAALIAGERASTTLELDLLRADGAARRCSITATALASGGRVVGVHGVASDVTAMRAAESARRSSEQRFRALFEHNPLAVVLMDRELRLRDANPAFERLAGRAVAAFEGRTLRPFVPRERLRPLVALLRSVLAGETRQTEERLRLPGAGPVDVRMTLLPVLIEGEVSGAFGIAEDIGSRLELEGQLRHAAKMEAVGRLAGGVAHDFNNLLTVISGHAELAQAEACGADLRQDLEEIRRTTERGAGLTRQLLLFSQTKMSEPRRVDPNRTIEDLRRMLARVVGEDKRITTDLAQGVWSVEVDPGLLDQVVLNLVINARDAMPAGGRIHIATRNRTVRRGEQGVPGHVLPGSYVEIRVEDTGEGMPPEVLDRIFEPFYTTKEPGKGTGLGLATVLGVVQRADGYVWAESRLGRGSRFTLVVPRAEGAAPEAIPPERLLRADAGDGPRSAILVVEDEDAVRTMTCRVLERRGHRVLSAGDPAAALDLASDPSVAFDLLLTDLVMPGMNGADLAQRIVDLRPGTPVIFMSGYVEEAVRRRVGADGRGTLLEKPFRAATLIRVVEAVARDGR